MTLQFVEKNSFMFYSQPLKMCDLRLFSEMACKTEMLLKIELILQSTLLAHHRYINTKVSFLSVLCLLLECFLIVLITYNYTVFFLIRSLGIKRHASNSGAILRCYGTDLDYIRPGISMYGLPPGECLKYYNHVVTHSSIIYHHLMDLNQALHIF